LIKWELGGWHRILGPMKAKPLMESGAAKFVAKYEPGGGQ